MAQLYLDTAQLATLDEVIRNHLRMLMFQIARSDDREFKHELVDQLNRLEDLQHSVEAASLRESLPTETGFDVR
jgi:hypothetical protein